MRLADMECIFWCIIQGFTATSGNYDDNCNGASLQVSKLGVTSILVSTREGVSVKTLREGLQAYNKHAR